MDEIENYKSFADWLNQHRDLRGIPIIVPVFNNPTYTKLMVEQCLERRLNIIVLDNNSDTEEMKECLNKIFSLVSVVKLSSNLGPFHTFRDSATYAALPEIFCLTDPDIEFNTKLPEDFLDQLHGLTIEYRIGKAGFSLAIDEQHLLKDDIFAHGMRIWEWEQRFWNENIGETLNGDPIYRADIDTTFALYNKRYFDPGNHYPALRLAGNFCAKHLPWYKQTRLPFNEDAKYKATQSFSSYLSSDGNHDERDYPYSSRTFDYYISTLVDLLRPKRVCDIGAGSGKLGRLIKDKSRELGFECRATAVEKRNEWIKLFSLEKIYDVIISDDALDAFCHSREEYDLVFLVDLLQYLDKSRGVDLINRLFFQSGYICIVYHDLEAGRTGKNLLFEKFVSMWGDADFLTWNPVHKAWGGMHLFLIKGILPVRMTINP